MEKITRLFAAASVLVFTGCGGSANNFSPSQSGDAFTIVQPGIMAPANLVRNGSFESPVAPSGSFLLFSTGQSFSHWTVVGASGNIGLIGRHFVYGGFNGPAGCGAQWVDLTGSSNSATGVQQAIKTVANTKYQLSFKVGNAYDPHGNLGTTSTVKVYVNGKHIFSATNRKGKGVKKEVWETFRTAFTARGQTVKLAFINGDPPTDTDNGLDCVVVTAP